jgi:hypothetical protein
LGLLLVMPVLHLFFCFAAHSNTGAGGWQWYPMFVIDLPFSVVLLFASQIMPEYLAYGVFGTIWWFAIGVFIRFIYRRIH